MVYLGKKFSLFSFVKVLCPLMFVFDLSLVLRDLAFRENTVIF